MPGMLTPDVPRTDPRPSGSIRRELGEGGRKPRTAAQGMHADDVLAQAMGSCFATLAGRLEDSVNSFTRNKRGGGERAVKSVHEGRVAIRKLHVLLGILRPLVGRKRTERLGKELKELGVALGDVRDLDVLIAAEDPPHDELERERQRARKVLRRRLDSEATHRLFRRLERLNARLLRRGTADEERPVMLVRDLLASTIIGHYEGVIRQMRDADAGSSRQLHLLRRYVRSLRYAIELFGEALAELRPQVLPRLVAAQQSLGELHDAEVAAQRKVTAGKSLEPLRRAALKNLNAIAAWDFHDAIFRAAQLPFKVWGCGPAGSPCAPRL